VGRPPIRTLTALSREFFVHPPSGFSELPLVTPCPSLTVADEDEYPLLDDCLETLRALGSPARPLDAAALRERVPILRVGPGALVGGVLDPEGYRIDAHALLDGYLRGMRRHGGRVLANTAVTGLRRERGRWHVDTGEDTLCAPVIVNAAGAWADALARLAGARPAGLTPMRRTAVTFALPAGVDARGWPFVKSVSERWYFVPEAGGLLLSPADETPAPASDVQPEEYDIAVAIDRFERVTGMNVERLRARWAGLRTFAPDRLPVVGYDPEVAGLFWLAGQGGAGLQTSPALSDWAAAVLDGSEPGAKYREAGLDSRVFSPARPTPSLPNPSPAGYQTP